MPIVARRMFVITCPRCGALIDLDGENGTFAVFDSVEQAEAGLEQRGYYDTKRVQGREKVTTICSCYGRRVKRGRKGDRRSKKG